MGPKKICRIVAVNKNGQIIHDELRKQGSKIISFNSPCGTLVVDGNEHQLCQITFETYLSKKTIRQAFSRLAHIIEFQDRKPRQPAAKLKNWEKITDDFDLVDFCR